MLLHDTQIELSGIPSGAPGIRQTLRAMRRMARAGRVSPMVRAWAHDIIAPVPEKDWRGQIVALHAWVRDNIRYVMDPDEVETVQTPEFTLENGVGDCDDKSVLLASLLGAIGHPSRFIAVAFEPGAFSHVYVETRLGPDWVPLETTEPVHAGFDPGIGAFDRMVEHI